MDFDHFDSWEEEGYEEHYEEPTWEDTSGWDEESWEDTSAWEPAWDADQGWQQQDWSTTEQGPTSSTSP